MGLFLRFNQTVSFNIQGPVLVMKDKYAASGVDEPREQAALQSMLKAFSRTYDIRSGAGSPMTEEDHFGSLIEITSDMALAVATDGVGTKLLIAQETGRYREIAKDLIANNVNDIICMGAEPIAFVDYIGLDVADEKFLVEFSEGLSDAALEAKVSIVGGEIAQIGVMLNSEHRSPRFDVVGTAIGFCSPATGGKWPKALSRKQVVAGSQLIALPSSGLHSNGFSLARKVLLDDAGYDLSETVSSLGEGSLAEHLLEPTAIYVRAIMPLLRDELVLGVANISGGGLLTVSRLNPKASFKIESLPTPPPIFEFIRDTGNLSEIDMHSTFNMGLGMVLAVAPEKVIEVERTLKETGTECWRIGEVVEGSAGQIDVIPAGIVGRGHTFEIA